MKKVLLLGDNHTRCENYEEVLKSLHIDYDLLLEADYSNYESLIIPGGIDVDPDLYHEEKDPKIEMFDRNFDDIQIKAIKHFVDNKKPILGICRGMQLLNVYFNGSLIQHIESSIDHRFPEHKEAYHDIKNDKETFMYELYGDSCRVNSLHHQCVDKLGDNLKIVSRSDDGIAEAMIHNELPIIMVQFHPERMALKQEGLADDGYPIFDYFLKMKAIK